MKQLNNYLLPFILVTSLFFFWGFVHNLDPILIPHLRRAFSLTTVQASLVDSAVFIAYFVMAIPAGIIMKKHGYKTGILIGLAFFAVGCFLFVPAANTMQYAFFFRGIVHCELRLNHPGDGSKPLCNNIGRSGNIYTAVKFCTIV